MPVTSFQTVLNQRDGSILFLNKENSGNNRQIRSQRSRGVGNCWIPWCTKDADFPPHHIEVVDKRSGVVIAFIWQHDDSVCVSEAGFEDPAEEIDGASRAGGSYDLLVTMEGVKAETST